MGLTSNMSFLLFGAFLTVVSAGAPLSLYPPSVPSLTYGPPRVEVPLAPSPVYGVPSVELAPLKAVSPAYQYEVIQAPKPIEYITSYQAPLYPAPAHPVPVASSYSYHVAPQPIRLLKTYAAPAPVYQHVAPAPVYSVPRYEIPAKPLLTSYDYSVPLVKSYAAPYAPAPYAPAPYVPAPYAPAPYAPAPYVPAPIIPLAPHTRYGLPHQ